MLFAVAVWPIAAWDSASPTAAAVAVCTAAMLVAAMIFARFPRSADRTRGAYGKTDYPTCWTCRSNELRIVALAQVPSIEDNLEYVWKKRKNAECEPFNVHGARWLTLELSCRNALSKTIYSHWLIHIWKASTIEKFMHLPFGITRAPHQPMRSFHLTQLVGLELELDQARPGPVNRHFHNNLLWNLTICWKNSMVFVVAESMRPKRSPLWT